MAIRVGSNHRHDQEMGEAHYSAIAVSRKWVTTVIRVPKLSKPLESGAILLHLGERSDALMPADWRSRCEALEWLFAALNSVEMASLPWSILAFSGDTGDTPGWKRLDEFLKARLRHLEPVLARRERLAGTFSVADILMADVLRLVDRFDGASGTSRLS
jgi:glutathione S-transferase